MLRIKTKAIYKHDLDCTPHSNFPHCPTNLAGPLFTVPGPVSWPSFTRYVRCHVSVVSSGPWLFFGLSFCLHRPIPADRCSLEGPVVTLTHFPGCSFLTGSHSTQVHLSRYSIARSSWCRLVLRLAWFASPLTNCTSLLFLPSCWVSAMYNSLELNTPSFLHSERTQRQYFNLFF